MPDGRSIFVSVQLPYAGVLNEVIEGGFNGNLFVGQSRGRINGFDYVHGFNYILGYYYWIRFVGNQARMTCKPINPQFPEAMKILSFTDSTLEVGTTLPPHYYLLPRIPTQC